MDGTRATSIFDIPKVVDTAEEEPKPKPKRKKSKLAKKKKPKVAKAGGVEVSQKTSVNGRKQLTLKHKGGLTQEITIYTGDQKPRGAKAKGQTANWNMKPAKFKKSRGLRDDRVYLQPPKREFFGNRYKSAMDKIKIDQKVKDAGQSKNKEIKDVRETASTQKKELERREAVKDDTISELKREKAGIVASHNVSQRNQSRATILGGDVGELNKLINRRGYASIRQLVIKGEITDDSTLLQLDLTQAQIDKLIKLRGTEQSEYVEGRKYVYVTPKGTFTEGAFISETASKIRLRKDGGGIVVVPKSSIQSGKEVSESRARSSDPFIVRGGGIPADLGSPRKRTESEERERPQHARRRDGKSRKRGAETPRSSFVKEAQFDLSESSEEELRSATKPEFDEARIKLVETLRNSGDENRTGKKKVRRKVVIQKEAEELTPTDRASPQAVVDVSDTSASESPISEGEEGEEFSGREEAPSSVGTSPESEIGSLVPTPEPEPEQLELILEESPAERRSVFVEEGESGGGSVKVQTEEEIYGSLPKLTSEQLQTEVDSIETGASKFTEAQLDYMIRTKPEDKDTNFLKSSFTTLRRRYPPDVETPREFFEGLKKPSRSRSRSVSQSPRPSQSPAVKKAGAAVTELVRSRSKEKKVLGLTPFEDPEAKAVREGKEFVESLGGGLAPKKSFRDEEGGGARKQRSPTPPTQYLTGTAIKEDTSETATLIVDNRADRARGEGRSKKRPVKEYSFESIELEIIATHGDSKKAANLLKKLAGAKANNLAFYTSDAELLKALGMRDA